MNSQSSTSLKEKKIEQQCIWSPADGYVVALNMCKLTLRSITSSSEVQTGLMHTVENGKSVAVLDVVDQDQDRGMVPLTTVLQMIQLLDYVQEKQVKRPMETSLHKNPGKLLLIDEIH